MQNQDVLGSGDQQVQALQRENDMLRDELSKMKQHDCVKEALISQLKRELQLQSKAAASQSNVNPLSTSGMVTAMLDEQVDLYEDNIGYSVATAMEKSQNEFMAKRMSLKNQDNEIQYTIQRLKDQWDNGEYKQVKW